MLHIHDGTCTLAIGLQIGGEPPKNGSYLITNEINYYQLIFSDQIDCSKYGVSYSVEGKTLE